MAEAAFGATVDFGTWDELAAAQERMRAEGWDVVPYDRPEVASRGFASSKGAERVLLRHLPFGRELEPVVRVCSSWREFVREIQFRAEEEMDKADDLEAGLVGFVTYGRAATSGKAEVFRISVEDLQAGGAEARSSLIAVLVASKHPGAEGLRAIRGK